MTGLGVPDTPMQCPAPRAAGRDSFLFAVPREYQSLEPLCAPNEWLTALIGAQEADRRLPISRLNVTWGTGAWCFADDVIPRFADKPAKWTTGLNSSELSAGEPDTTPSLL